MSMTRRTSRRRTSRRLRRNSTSQHGYQSNVLPSVGYLKLAEKLVRSVLHDAGYRPANNFEEDRKSWRQARIDALAALMVDGMDDDRSAAIQERSHAITIAAGAADEISGRRPH
jgi:hypothetical protein